MSAESFALGQLFTALAGGQPSRFTVLDSAEAVPRVMAEHWLKFDSEGNIGGCQCGFAADLDSDCGYGDSVVAHIVRVTVGDPL